MRYARAKGSLPIAVGRTLQTAARNQYLATRNPSDFHDKWKYNGAASNGKEEILPQGGLDF